MVDKAAHSKANERKQAQLNSLSEKLGKCQGQYEALKAEKKLLIKRLTNNKH